jgi:L-threonylcarbamoyladenylate synthase
LTDIIKADSPESHEKAASVLTRGGIIVYPTETLYGIGALAFDEKAVVRVFDVKGRPHGKPIPILARDKEMILELVEVTEEASMLIDRFLPGALTLVLREKKVLPRLISAGTGKIAVRISGHPFVRRLFDLLTQPITSTSANISGMENVFSFNGVYETFNGKVELIVDSGNLPPSKGSTVIDLTVKPPLMIREGDIGKEELEEFLKW